MTDPDEPRSASYPVYDRVKPLVAGLEERFYELLNACDAYDRELEDVVAGLDEDDEAAQELTRRLRHQQREVRELTECLEDDAMGVLLRIRDRIVMVRVTEEGRFV